MINNRLITTLIIIITQNNKLILNIFIKNTISFKNILYLKFSLKL
jgi:hypothetical protein